MASKTQSFKMDEYSFILNLRDQSSGCMKKADMVEALGAIKSSELIKLREYSSITENSDYINELTEQGWYRKDYETARKCVESHFVRRGLKFVYNKPKKTTDKEDITRLLFFAKLKGQEITSETIQLVPEQQEVVDICEGIKLVNSGPGTGKTTTAVFIAKKYASEGVWLVSYTNAAVDNIVDRLYQVVDNVKHVGNDPSKKICVTTIDTICSSMNKGAYRNVSFEKRISAANRDIDQRTDIFLDNENNLRFKHLVIDEAQDISDDRFKYLFNIFRTWGFKSMTIVGDPRQRMNRNAGALFQSLFKCGIRKGDGPVKWSHEKLRWITDNDSDSDDDSEVDWYLKCKPLIFNYHVTFRFQNPVLMQLCNHLSSQRQAIHSELTLHDGIEQVESNKVVKYESFNDMAAEIAALVKSGVKPNQICLMSPITDKECKIRTEFKAIQQLLSTQMIICSDKIRDNTIYASSIISAKGLEFDYVFMVGASRFPSFLNEKFTDINDGVSMNFVANTRARICMYYLTDKSKLPPDGVPQELVTGEIVKRENFMTREVYRKSIRTDSISPSDYKDYEQCNRTFLTIEQQEMPKCHLERGKYHTYTYEIISAVLCKIGGLNILRKQEPKDKTKPMSTSNLNSFAMIPEDVYNGYVETGQIIDITNGNLVIVKQGTDDEINALLIDGDEDDIEYHRTYAKVVNGRRSMLDSIMTISEPMIQISNIIIGIAQRNEGETAEHHTLGTYIKSPAIVGHTYVIVFTESVFVAAEVKSLYRNKKVIMIGLESGTFNEITRVPSAHRRYAKVCQDLYTLSSAIKLMQRRGKFSLAELNQDRDIYFVDTEFTTTKWNKSGTVYEIAVINAFRPYRSFVTYLRPDPRRFNIIVGDQTLRYEELADAPTAFDFISVFNTATSSTGTKPIIYYFSTKHDIAVFYETHPMYHEAWGIDEDSGEMTNEIDRDGDNWKYDPTIDYGFHFIDGRVGNTTGKLNELYNITTGSSLGAMPHLVHHVAISDALMLMEFVLTRDHPI